ncbi:armadillo repeat-containing protein 7 isoform X1 [Drosophila busckii]|uniref:armadillo repeat-containing protein 7 isoform X1 n=1 Tax=Drosophila busckii TaxID=30019 RepID=UPI00083EB8A9|nr:armadillo repeat-containing protein 7 isoform X1 [Drosophila busckii]
MYYSHRYLKRKTPEGGINRREYIGHLVDEYYTSTNVEAQEQVTANLANFAYDPLNWPHLLGVDALDVFLAALETHNPNLQLHSVAAFCNICLDKNAVKFIIENIVTIKTTFLSTEHAEVVLHSLALFYQLLKAELSCKEAIITPELLKRVQHWRKDSNDERVVKLCQVFLEDFGCRTEVFNLSHVVPPETAALHTGSSSTKTGDYNYIHSKELPVKERRVHGALLNAVVAGIIGTKLPGPGTVVLEQNFKFLKPCRLETDTVVTVRLLEQRKISTVEYDCRQRGDVVFAGKAKLLTRSDAT